MVTIFTIGWIWLYPSINDDDDDDELNDWDIEGLDLHGLNIDGLIDSEINCKT